MRASFETSDAPYERVVSSAMHAVQWHCQRSDVEAELSRAKARQKWHKQRPPRSSVSQPYSDSASQRVRWAARGAVRRHHNSAVGVHFGRVR